MSGRQRLTLILVGAVVAAAAFLLLRPGDDEDESPARSSTTETQTTTATSETETQPAKPPAPEAERIAVRGGKPAGGAREIDVTKDDTVRITVTVDAPAHVHVHGYDLLEDATPDRPARFRFEADAEGVFEVELEDTATQIARLKVEP